MAKRLSQLDRAIRDLEEHIRDLQMEVRGLEKARDHLVLQRSTPPGPVAAPPTPIRRRVKVAADPVREVAG